MPLVSAQDLATYLRQDVDTASAELLIDLATDLCLSIVSPLPATAKATVLTIAARAYANPQNVQSETTGPYLAAWAVGGGGLYLAKSEKANLLRMGGRGGAFTVDPTAADAGSDIPSWSQNGSLLA